MKTLYWIPNTIVSTTILVIFWCLYIWWRQSCFIYSWIRKHLTFSWRSYLSYRNQSIDLLCKSTDWFLYDRDLRHERVKYLHALEQAKDVIKPLQINMMVLLTKIVSNIGLKTLTSHKKINLSCLNFLRRSSADGYITVCKFQTEICKDRRRAKILINYLHFKFKS